MLYCSLCFKTKDEHGDKSFFKVPKEEQRRKQWGEICRIDFKKKTAWICKDHFLPSEIVKCGKKTGLVSHAVPFIRPYQGNNIQKNGVTSQKAATKVRKNKTPENENRIFSENVLNNNVVLPQTQEEILMKIPVQKSRFCTESTQTNMRLCGLVQASEFADDFRFNCFYCCEVFPLENYKEFINHLKNEHFEKEKAFEVSEYVSKEHDYAPINIPSSTQAQLFVVETIGIHVESLLPMLVDAEEPRHSPVESTLLHPNFYYTPDDNNIDILNYLIESGSSFIVVDSEEHGPLEFTNLKAPQISAFPNDNKDEHYTPTEQKNLNSNKKKKKSVLRDNKSKKTVLSRCLKRTIKVKDDFVFTTKATEISFEYTPRVIVDLLLDSVKDYPVLWEFNNEPFNENFCKAVEKICKIINDKWSLNIDNLKMLRSINRILRFYCYLFPNENVENIHQYTCYYDKCATFLPSSVNDISYARCSHCYICYKNDFDLKHHLLKEQKYNLQWPYKCVQCKECFRDDDEYQFHKLLSHYDEVFRCEPCNKKFTRRNIYNRHIAEYHSNIPKEPGKYKCNICNIDFETIHNLRYHKIKHGERKYKCHLCPKSYFENAKLSLHLKIHRGEYDFMCEVCGKAFPLQAPLNVHMKKHTGEKVTCSICNIKLRKSSLSRHMRLLHGTREATVSTNGNRKQVNYRRLIRPTPFRRKKESEGRKYHCKICTMRFEQYKLLAEHNKALHSDIPKLSCQMCSTEFRHKVNLKRHYRRKHDLHVIQAYKLVEENEDLHEVLAIKVEHLNNLAGSSSKESTIIKSEFLSTEISFEEEKLQTFTIAEQILKADCITKEEIKIDYMTDFLTDILK